MHVKAIKNYNNSQAVKLGVKALAPRKAKTTKCRQQPDCDQRLVQQTLELNQYQALFGECSDDAENPLYAEKMLRMAIHEEKSQFQKPALSIFISYLATSMLIGCTIGGFGIL